MPGAGMPRVACCGRMQASGTGQDARGSTGQDWQEAMHDDREQLRQPRHAAGRRDQLRDPPAGRGRRRRRSPVQPQGPAGEPAADRGRRERHARARHGARGVGPGGRAGHRDPVQPGAGDHAGPDRRARGRRPGHHARGHAATSAATRARSTRWSRPSWSSTTRWSPTCSAGRTRSSATWSSSSSATASGSASCAGARRRFSQFKVVPPGTGIVHQVNIEHLARVVMTSDAAGGADDARRRRGPAAYPDTCVGTDSHTTMQNGLGVLGWGVGGIEAEAAMLGQPVSMLIPRVVGFRLTGELPAGATATDLVLTITELLRKHGVVGKFVEFHGDGVAAVPVANRATIGNMSPEFGSTCAIFPIDAETLDLPAADRAQRRAGRAGRGVRQGAGPVARARHAGGPLLRGTRARPVHGGPVAGRPEAAAGPGGADRRQDLVPRGARRLRRSSTAWTRRSPTRSRRLTRSPADKNGAVDGRKRPAATASAGGRPPRSR